MTLRLQNIFKHSGKIPEFLTFVPEFRPPVLKSETSTAKKMKTYHSVGV